jgi:SWI/SNF-related matrix-associated actin-dependent regulator of chromatin subfamily A-like protein 1
MTTLLDTTLPFPKYRGRTLRQLAGGSQDERGYVEWMARDFRDEPWREAASAALGLDAGGLVQTRHVYTLDMATSLSASLTFPYDQQVATLLRDRVDGMSWQRKAGRWEFPRTQIATVVGLLERMGEVELSAAAQQALEAERRRRARLDGIRNRTEARIEIPTLLPLFGFQAVGVEFALAAGGRALIADEMGLGKTLQAIAVALVLLSLGSKRVLVACPASLKINWYREFIRFGGIEPTVWYGPKVVGDRDAAVHVINFDIFFKYREELEALGFDLLIIDEAHYLKNKDAARTQAIYGGYHRKSRKRLPPFPTRYAVLLTGTPVLNRPAELFPSLNYLAPDRFKDWFSYANRYGAWTPGNLEGRPWRPQNLDELHERTKDLVIRRRKAEVLPDLPPKLVSDLYVTLTAEQRRDYRHALGVVAEEWRAKKPSLVELQVLQALLNNVKLDKVREIIDELQNEDDVRPVLVFCTRLDPLRTLRAEYGERAVYIDGSMTPEARQVEVDRFQQGKASIALLSVRAAGVGLNLTTADTVVFIDQDFVPATHQQAEDRAHRIGQVNPVQVYYLLAEDTVDEDLRALLAEKLYVTSQITDGESKTLERQRSVFGDFVRRLKARHRQFAKLPDEALGEVA